MFEVIASRDLMNEHSAITRPVSLGGDCVVFLLFFIQLSPLPMGFSLKTHYIHVFVHYGPSNLGVIYF